MNNKFKVPANEINQRTLRIQKVLQGNGIDSLLIVQRVDLFYFSGTAQNGVLYIPAEGEPLLFIIKYMPRAQKESSIKNIIEIKSIKEIPDLISDFYGRLPHVFGLEYDVLPVKDFNFFKTLFHDQKFVDVSPYILKTRMIKSGFPFCTLSSPSSPS